MGLACPKKYSLNGAIPEFTNIKVGSFFSTIGADGTMRCSFFLKKFKKLGQANNGYVKVEVVDGEPMIGGAKILASIKAGNGIVHVIDKVLLPPTE